MEQKMEFKDYLFSSHGADLGFSYVLPKNVRVILPCLRDSVSADVETDSKLWSAFITNPDLELNYLNNIMINIENPDKKYCVFSGNLIDGKNNIIPNLFIAPEEEDLILPGLIWTTYFVSSVILGPIFIVIFVLSSEKLTFFDLSKLYVAILSRTPSLFL